MEEGDWGELSTEELMTKKENIETDIQSQNTILELQGDVGMSGVLVDSDGFPRADIDIYAVRTARKKIICLRNDHKMIMRLIEERLHQIHAEAREKSTGSMTSSDATNGKGAELVDEGFAKVNIVTEHSPAALAGLLVDDVIVEFGSVRKSTFSTLQDISSVVGHSQGRPLRVVVNRKGVKMILSLTPQQWSGRGLLGCNILPMTR